jgi:hypothetical protein
VSEWVGNVRFAKEYLVVGWDGQVFEFELVRVRCAKGQSVVGWVGKCLSVAGSWCMCNAQKDRVVGWERGRGWGTIFLNVLYLTVGWAISCLESGAVQSSRVITHGIVESEWLCERSRK